MLVRTHQFFVSPKCQDPVPHCGGIGHDLLVQLALDPKIAEIGYLDRVSIGDLLIDAGLITIRCDDGRCFAIDCAGLHCPADSDSELVWQAANLAGFDRLHVPRVVVMAEPAFSNARATWAHRRFAVDPTMRVAMLEILHEDGPLRLSELCQRVPGPRDPVATTFALACADLVEIDMCLPLDQTALIRSRRG